MGIFFFEFFQQLIELHFSFPIFNPLAVANWIFISLQPGTTSQPMHSKSLVVSQRKSSARGERERDGDVELNSSIVEPRLIWRRAESSVQVA